MADQALVPKGLPYGERQKMVEARAQAGLANDPRPQPQPTTAPGMFGRFDPLRQATPDQFPALGDPSTMPTPRWTMPPAQAFADIAARSQSTLMQRVAERLRNANPQM